MPVYAEDFSFKSFKDSFSPGETAQFEISIATQPEFPIATKDVKLKSSTGENMKIAPFLSKLKSDLYFLSFEVPQLQDGNYSIMFENLLFKENNKLVQKSISSSMPISYSEPILSISPAFFKSDDQVNLEVFDKKKSTEITIDSPQQLSHVYSTPQSIQESKSRLFKFTLNDKNFTIIQINLSYDGKSYFIPVYNFAQAPQPQPPQQVNQSQIVNQANKSSMEFSAPQSSINRSISRDTVLEGSVNLRNSGELDLQNITLALTGNLADIVSISPSQVPSLSAEQSIEIMLAINKNQNPLTASYSGNLVATSGSLSISYPIYVSIESKDVVNQPDIRRTEPQTPQETQEEPDMYGNLLNYSNYTTEVQESKVSSSFIIIIITLIIGVLVYVFSRKKTEHRSFDDLLKPRKK